MRHLVEDYLQDQPLFRERKNKDRGIVNLLINRYGLHHAIERGEITKTRLVALVQDFSTMDRAWRKTLEEKAHLRGSDYDEKDELENKAMHGLGYNVGESTPTEATLPDNQPTLI